MNLDLKIVYTIHKNGDFGMVYPIEAAQGYSRNGFTRALFLDVTILQVASLVDCRDSCRIGVP